MTNVMDPNFAPPPQTIRLTPHQMATMLVIEGAMATLQMGSNQLGGFLGLKDEADLLMSACNHLGKGLEEMKREWEGKVVLVGAGAMPAERTLERVK
jgi:hypothetical protein